MRYFKEDELALPEVVPDDVDGGKKKPPRGKGATKKASPKPAKKAKPSGVAKKAKPKTKRRSPAGRRRNGSGFNLGGSLAPRTPAGAGEVHGDVSVDAAELERILSRAFAGITRTGPASGFPGVVAIGGSFGPGAGHKYYYSRILKNGEILRNIILHIGSSMVGPDEIGISLFKGKPSNSGFAEGRSIVSYTEGATLMRLPIEQGVASMVFPVNARAGDEWDVVGFRLYTGEGSEVPCVMCLDIVSESNGS